MGHVSKRLTGGLRGGRRVAVLGEPVPRPAQTGVIVVPMPTRELIVVALQRCKECLERFLAGDCPVSSGRVNSSISVRGPMASSPTMRVGGCSCAVKAPRRHTETSVTRDCHALIAASFAWMSLPRARLSASRSRFARGFNEVVLDALLVWRPYLFEPPTTRLSEGDVETPSICPVEVPANKPAVLHPIKHSGEAAATQRVPQQHRGRQLLQGERP